MDLEKIYLDIDGNKKNIIQMVKCDPEWAANRIQEGEKVAALKNTIEVLFELCDRFFVGASALKYFEGDYQCMYCGATMDIKGNINHSYSDCPVIQYNEIKAREVMRMVKIPV